MIAKDKFYRDLSESKLRAAYEAIKRNIENGILVEGMTKEKELALGVAKERGIDLEARTIRDQIETVKGYIEFYQEKGE